jgi:hypothetical protein
MEKTMLKQLALAAFAAAALGATVATAAPITSGGCPTWMCGTIGNGTQLTGLTVHGVIAQIGRVILPSGEIVALP